MNQLYLGLTGGADYSGAIRLFEPMAAIFCNNSSTSKGLLITPTTKPDFISFLHNSSKLNMAETINTEHWGVYIFCYFQ